MPNGKRQVKKTFGGGGLIRRKNGSGDRARTCNILVNSQALYH